MAFQHIVTVRFNEVDRAGIAFFGRVYEYCHVVFEELLVAMGNSISNVFDNGKWGMPLVHSHADYKRPMRLGEELTIEVTVPTDGRHFHYFRLPGARSRWEPALYLSARPRNRRPCYLQAA